MFYVTTSYAGFILFQYNRVVILQKADSLNRLAISASHNGDFAEAIRLDEEALRLLVNYPGSLEQVSRKNILSNLVVNCLKLKNYIKASTYEKERVELSISEILDAFTTMTSKERTTLWMKNSYVIEKESPLICYNVVQHTTNSLCEDELLLICELTDSLNDEDKYSLLSHQAIPWGIQRREWDQWLQKIQDRTSPTFDLEREGERRRMHRRDSIQQRINAIRKGILTKCNWSDEEYETQLLGTQKKKEILETTYNGTLLRKGFLLNSEIELRKMLLENGDTTIIRLYDDLFALRQEINQLEEMPLRQQNAEMIFKKQQEERKLDSILILKSNEYGDYTLRLRYDWHDVQSHLSNKDIAIEFLRIPIHQDSVMYVAMTLKKGYKAPKMITLFEEYAIKAIEHETTYSTTVLSELLWKPLSEELQHVHNIYFSPDGYLFKIAVECLPGLEQYNLYRLSSTRELCNERNKAPNKQSVLYGGLQYGNNLQSYKNTHNNRSERGAINCLPLLGSEKEVITIGEIMKRSLIPTQIIMKENGTEESFKSLSGKKTSLIHLATHGFYTPEESEDSISHLMLELNDTTYNYREDRSLSHSGLFFSGWENLLSVNETDEEHDDGILTAYETAFLDLRGLNLVALSACDTAQGDISSDGVFGLQRGFKKAGAQSILMSLWKVDDEATCLLMTEFYKNWIGEKMTKHDALEKAKQTVRSHKEKGWDDPKYWAAFILLDGLD